MSDISGQPVVYEVGDRVRFNQQLCACIGGGFAKSEGRIVGTLHNSKWFKIDQPNGIVVTKLENILEKLS